MHPISAVTTVGDEGAWRHMRYLVTGGAGFIGSHLSEELVRRGHEVSVVDDLSTGSLGNLSAVTSSPRFRSVVASCDDPSVMRPLIAWCDGIFHLAAEVGVARVVASPIRTIRTNIRLTEALLEAADAHRKPVLLTSTSEVYGKSEDLPFREDADLLLGATDKGRWSYACSKALGEFLGLAYWRERQLPVVVVRLFNTLGPRQSDKYGMVVPRLVRQALAGAPLSVYGDGSQSRCFTHVLDVVRGLATLMESGAHFGQVFNVGNTEEIAIVELARRIQELVGGPSRISFVAYEQAYGPGFEDMRRRVPDIGKIRRAIGWQPTLGLSRILADVISHCRAVS